MKRKPVLLRCICGGDTIITITGNEHTRTRKVNIRCIECRTERTDAGVLWSTERLTESAIRRWNKTMWEGR